MEEPELELYTIPAQSSWFVWDDIHEIERREFEEFFTESSITRTPKVYKEYRDFIINKYREDTTRKLTFTSIRKFLVGDVNLLQKVFLFLENWGLINFAGPKKKNDDGDDDEVKDNAQIEEGIPNGIRVTATPNSFKPITAPPQPIMEERGETVKLPPLTSYSDVFIDSKKKKEPSDDDDDDNELVCGNCKERSDSAFYEHKKSDFKICKKCFDNGNYGEENNNNSADEFKLIGKKNSESDSAVVWSEEEILLLLESVLKHGDDWELIAQSVTTKSRLDCISKLIELPFGEFLMGSASASSGRLDSSIIPIEEEVKEHEETKTIEEEEEEEEPPAKKRKCVGLISDGGSSLMKQVVTMVSKAGVSVTTAATKAAIEALCDEASCPKEIFETADYKNRDDGDKDTDMEEKDESSDLPVALRIRVAVATALGAAAAQAKILADQEEREMELLAATVIDQQLKKLKSKLKFMDDLELIMDTEEKLIDNLKETILQERISVLQSAFRSGITKRWDHTYVK